MVMEVSKEDSLKNQRKNLKLSGNQTPGQSGITKATGKDSKEIVLFFPVE